MIGSVKYKKLSCSKSIISFFISVAAVAALALTVLPVASAAPSRVKSPLLEPVPSVVDNGDGTKTITVYVLRAAVGGSDGQNKSILFEMVYTIPSSATSELNLISQQGSCVLVSSDSGSSVAVPYDVSSGSADISTSFSSPYPLESYQLHGSYTRGFQFIRSYFPRSWGMYSGPSVYVHAWVPDGVTLYNNLGSYYVDDWVDWSVNPAENIFYSHLDRPVQDIFNRYFVAYNRKTKEGLLIHFNVALNGVFEAMFDAVNTYNGYTISGDGELAVDDDFVNLEGYYGSTDNVYQGTISHNNNDELTVSFDVPGSSGSISAELNQLVDGRSFSPELDMSSGSEVWKLYQPSIIYSTYGAIVCHYQIVVGIYSLLDGSLQSQFVFDSILGSQNQVILDIGSPLAALHPTHILTFGTNYVPDLSAGFNWGCVQWSVDPVVLQWRSDVISNIQQIRDLLQQQIGEDATQLNQSAVHSFHQAEDALQVKDGNGQPIDVAAQAEEQFDGALDGVRSLSGAGGAFQFLNTSIGEIFTDPLLVLPVIVALALGVAITILGKNKSE